jgi:uncharacterized OB-fold protein
VPVIAPVVNHDDKYFWDGVAGSQLLLRRCANCSRVQHPPTPMCQKCGGVEWTAQPASGRGVVHSWIVSKHPTEPDGSGRVVVLVELTEGVRLVANLTGIEPESIVPELPVEVYFAELDGVRLPQFRPVAGAAV